MATTPGTDEVSAGLDLQQFAIWKPAGPGRMRLLEKELPPIVVRQLLIQIGLILRDLPYMVFGHAALTTYGYETSYIKHVSLVCPPGCSRQVQEKAEAFGLATVPGPKSAFGFKIHTGRVALVRILETNSDDAWETLGGSRFFMNKYHTAVATLPATANWFGYVWNTNQRRTDATPEEIKKQAYYIGGKLIWCLRQMATMEEDGQKFTRDDPPKWIANSQFWPVFEAYFPDSEQLFAKAGLDIAAVVASQQPPVVPEDYVKSLLVSPRKGEEDGSEPPPPKDPLKQVSFNQEVTIQFFDKFAPLRGEGSPSPPETPASESEQDLDADLDTVMSDC